MTPNVLLMLPDFGLILLGAVLARLFKYPRGFWEGAEKLVYYVLFPPLLFSSIIGAKFSFAAEGKLLAAAVASFFVAVAFAFLARPLFRPRRELFASCVQTAFRYNSYVGLALAQALFGAKGVALLALIIAFCIPLANAFAVYALARHQGANVLRELAVNPLILSTVAGLVANLSGLELPLPAANFLARLGGASLAVGLLCIGAGLAFDTVRDDRRTMIWFTVVKLLIAPAAATAMVMLLGLRGIEAQAVVLFAALPTASSSYILAARMGGHAAPVAVLVTMQTLLAMATLPVWVALAPA